MEDAVEGCFQSVGAREFDFPVVFRRVRLGFFVLSSIGRTDVDVDIRE